MADYRQSLSEMIGDLVRRVGLCERWQSESEGQNMPERLHDVEIRVQKIELRMTAYIAFATGLGAFAGSVVSYFIVKLLSG